MVGVTGKGSPSQWVTNGARRLAGDGRKRRREASGKVTVSVVR